MLVLTRRPGESVLIGDGVRVRILRSSGSRVRIGIEAPADLRIVREDVLADLDGAEDAEVARPATPRPSAVEDCRRDDAQAVARLPRFRTGVPLPGHTVGADRHVSLE